MINVKQTRHGRMIYQATDMWTGYALELYGEAKQLEIDFLESLISEGDVMMDIGANVGTITLPMAKKIGPKGYVLALEAHAMFFYTLCGNLSLNELTHVQVFNRSAADKTGSMFYFPKFDFSKNDSFSDVRLAGLLNSKDEFGHIFDNPVTAIAVDDLGIATPNLIKIDVNGMEPVVLNGMRKTIKRANPILYIEFSNNWRYIMDYLKSVDYEWSIHEPPLFNPNNYHNISENFLIDPETKEPLSSRYLVGWHKSKNLNLNNPYIVDLENSTNPQHAKMKVARDGRTTDFSIAE